MATRSPESNAPDEEAINGAQRRDITRQLKNQTPMAKSHEQAVESSPMGERGATGSRPPTRSRGYSSTLSIAGRKGDMSSKIPGTPAFESSILSNFRRRPRQPSILQMMQAEDGSSDLDDDDFLGGLSPEDESTPLNLSRGKSLLARKDSSSPSEPRLPSSGSSRKRKRSPDELPAPQSPSPGVRDSLIGSQTSDVEDEVRRHSSSLELPPHSDSQDVFSQTMAPPMSSPLSSPTQTMPVPDLSVRLDAPPEKGKKNADQKSSSRSGLSTANLQDRLLPRRRPQQQRKRRHVTNFEMPSDSSGLESDQDELSYVPSKSRRPQQRATRQKHNHLSAQRKASKQKATEPVAQQHGTAQSTTAQPKSDVSDTLATKSGSLPLSHPTVNGAADKENEPNDLSSPLSSPMDTDALESDVPSEPSSPAVKYLSEELRLQARKFAEIDAWKMDFEDVPDSQV